MAILIDTSVNILGGYVIPSLYLRLFYSHDVNGNSIHISTEKYINKQSFLAGSNNSLKDVIGIPSNMNFNYNRSIDGVDTMGHAHKKLKDFLSTDQTQQIAMTDPSTGQIINDPSTMSPVLDPSSGLPMTDPSTGEIILDTSTGTPIYETVVIATKFAPADKIYFIDLDPSIV